MRALNGADSMRQPGLRHLSRRAAFDHGSRTAFAGMARRVLAVALGSAWIAGWAAPAGADHRMPADVVVSTRSSWEPFIQAVIERFEAANPDLSIAYQIQPGADQLIVQLAAGEGPDIFETSGDTLKRMAELGALYDLAPMVQRDFGERERRDFFPPVWAATELRAGARAGMRVGLPFYINAPVFWFNRTLFSQAALSTPDELDARGDWNWSALLTAARKLTRRGAAGNPVQYGVQTKYWSRNLISRPTWIWANGGRVFAYPEDPARFVMDEPAALEALRFVQDLVWTEEVMPKRHPVDEHDAFEFVKGNLAIDDDGTQVFEEWAEAIGSSFDYDVAKRPMGKAGRGNRTSLDVYAMSAQANDIAATWRFLRFLVSPEMQRLQTQMLKLGPVRASAVESFVSLSRDLDLSIYLETAATAQVDPFSFIDRAEEFRRLIQPALVSAMERNEKPIAVAIREVAGPIRALFGR